MKNKYEITCEDMSSDGWINWVVEDSDGKKIYIEGAHEDLVKNLISDANQDTVGNAAKMREALNNIKQEAETTCEYMEYPIAGAPGERGTCPVVDAEWIINECKSALSAPPRNCDRFNNLKEAKIRYCAEVGYVCIWDGVNTEKLIKWLFAEAKGETENGEATK